jgi:DNA-binding NtrC family response regulator
MSGAVNAAADAGRLAANGFVKKPMDLDQLRETLHQIDFPRTRAVTKERRSTG